MICPSTAQRLFRPDGSNNNIDFIFLNIFDIRSILLELILHFKFLLPMNVCNPKGSAAMVHLCVYVVVFFSKIFFTFLIFTRQTLKTDSLYYPRRKALIANI